MQLTLLASLLSTAVGLSQAMPSVQPRTDCPETIDVYFCPFKDYAPEAYCRWHTNHSLDTCYDVPSAKLNVGIVGIEVLRNSVSSIMHSGEYYCFFFENAGCSGQSIGHSGPWRDLAQNAFDNKPRSYRCTTLQSARSKGLVGAEIKTEPTKEEIDALKKGA